MLQDFDKYENTEIRKGLKNDPQAEIKTLKCFILFKLILNLLNFSFKAIYRKRSKNERDKDTLIVCDQVVTYFMSMQ